jgi:hypothetical protein
MMGLEQLTDDDLGRLQERLERVRARAAVELERQDTLLPPNGKQGGRDERRSTG